MAIRQQGCTMSSNRRIALILVDLQNVLQVHDIVKIEKERVGSTKLSGKYKVLQQSTSPPKYNNMLK